MAMSGEACTARSNDRLGGLTIRDSRFAGVTVTGITGSGTGGFAARVRVRDPNHPTAIPEYDAATHYCAAAIPTGITCGVVCCAACVQL